jgi:site-specific DNA recombinase
MQQIVPKIKYILYARKSSESEDRQVASIESQKKVLKELAQKDGLEIIDALTESQSAKGPGRPVFNKMIEKISNGEAQGIICWKLDRLARNPVDGGTISWMLQTGIIKHIQTYERNYYSNDNVLMMSVEFGMANQFIRDLSQNVKRGLKTKAEQGWYPRSVPIGYLNNPVKQAEKAIIKDSERFDLVRKMFNLMLAGGYSPPKILEIATNEWGLRNKDKNPMSRSNIYRIFTDPFYYGDFELPLGSGNWYHGKHEPMITEQEYDNVQILLGKRGRPRTKKHSFAFTGLIRCGECGSMITAEEHIKKQKNGNVHHYIYYRCTKRKKHCSQKYIEEKKLEKQILTLLEKIEIPIEFYDWAIEQLKIESQKEIQDRTKILESQKKAYNNSINKIDQLLEMRINNEINEEEFTKKKLELQQEKLHFQELLNDTDKRINKWIEKAENVFNFAKEAKSKFESGTPKEKQQILLNLGSNPVLKDQNLSILIQKPLLLVEKAAPEVKKINNYVRTSKNVVKKRDFEVLYSQNPLVQGHQDSNLEQRFWRSL